MRTLPSARELQKSFDEAWATIYSMHLFVVSGSKQYLQFLCKGYCQGRLDNFVSDLDNEVVLKPKILAKCLEMAVEDIARKHAV